MRKALLSLSVVTAFGTTLVSSGAFSLFNDTATATGAYSTGTVVLTLGTNTFQGRDTCQPRYTGAAAPTDPDQNMASVNNNSCVSRIPVTNAGTLPMVIASTQVTDVVSRPDKTAGAGSPVCFSSVITGADLAGVFPPNGNRDIHVTTTVNTDNAFQGLTDAVTAVLNVTEAASSR